MSFRQTGTPAGSRRPDAPLDDQAMIHHARTLAVSLSIDGEARFSLRGCTPAELRRIGAEAQQASSGGAAQTPGMEWLTDNIRLVESVCSATHTAKRSLLPASSGIPRIQYLMRELVVHGDAQVGRERLLEVISAFDDVHGLLMEELWCVPVALRVELCASFAGISRHVLAAQRDRNSAESWVQSGADITYIQKYPHTSAFYERALQLMHEQEMPKARRALEEWLEERDTGAENVILFEHELQALDRLWLSNIMQTLRMLDSLDWGDCFSALSRTERLLMEDPRSIYPAMDDSSRTVIRDQVRILAKASGISEVTVTRYALRAAEGAPDMRGGICHWLYDDDGRQALMHSLGSAHARIPQITPDPEGNAYILSAAILTFLIWLIVTVSTKSLLLSLLAAPVSWGIASAILNSIITHMIKPRILLKLEIDEVPDQSRTLIVIPALISSKKRAVELLEELETLGCLEHDKNIDFLLLGDFRDSQSHEEPDDDDIVNAARNGIAHMNSHSQRAKYFYLHRMRTFSAGSNRWMGHERKRGALMALGELLMDGKNNFDAEGRCAKQLTGRYTYIITLDSGTRMLPNVSRQMLGAIAHPLNARRIENGIFKGYTVLQPRMELSSGSVTSDFIRLLGGHGGIDSYPTAVSDVYQDFTGHGIYGGKGIYDLRAFHDGLEGVLPDNALVCHDLIEGSVVGAGFLNDVTLHDGFPRTLSAYFKRLERWTRGDWQLIPYMGKRLPISSLSRYMMLSNLFRTMSTPAALFLIICSAWTSQPAGLLLGLLLPLFPAILTLRHLNSEAWWRAVAHVSLLPLSSFYLLSGAIRALTRLHTRRNMLEWVTAADADGLNDANLEFPGRIAALLLLPGVIHPQWIIGVLGFGALFLIGVPWMRGLEKEDEEGKLTAQHIHALSDLAKSTWHFFDVYVPKDGPGLPPDNVQMDPPVGVAHRTSPTNIGLYMLSCLSAMELNLISREELCTRIERTVDTLEKLEKWHGQLYNWYDTQTLAPLKPRYVSSVDGGNLAACLMLLAEALRTDSSARTLAERLTALVGAMEFETLYNKKRHLFAIGADVENDRLSASHYDLLASESRILSYVSMMLGKVSVRHWNHLGKSVVRAGDGQALLSWSGTMFEYLMPELLMRAPRESLLAHTNRAVVEAQRETAERNGMMPWGISESGYNAFDMQMNYQYRAFGLTQLSLRGSPDSMVIAPYAGILALCVEPASASQNLLTMLRLGWHDEYGLYEAVDYTHERCAEGAPYHIVYSHMAHHQGMIMVAIANALRDDMLVKYFMRQPKARALSLLLEEKPAARTVLSKRAVVQESPRALEHPSKRTLRTARGNAILPDAHLLYGGGGTYFTTAGGAGFLRVNGVMANRFGADPAMPPDGLFVHINLGEGKCFCASGQRITPDWLTQRAVFDAGTATWTSKAEGLEAQLLVSVAPEDGALVQRLKLVNHTSSPLCVEATSCFAVALAAQADMQAHPAFQNLFIESSLADGTALMFKRRARGDEVHPTLLHIISGVPAASVTWESDLAMLIGRTGQLSDGSSLADKLSGSLGSVLNPCSALRSRIEIPPGGQHEVAFTVAMTFAIDVTETLAKHAAPESARRTEQLAVTQAHALLRFLGIDGISYQLLARTSAFLMYPRLPYDGRGEAAKSCNASVSGLWALGVSGDLPIISVFIAAKDQLELVREAIRAHEFYRMMGVWCDLLLINEYGNDYDQPIRDSLRELIAASHLRELIGESGGAFFIEGAALTDTQRTLIHAVSGILLKGGQGTMGAQLRRQFHDNGAYSAVNISPMKSGDTPLPDIDRKQFNGYGGFSADGHAYIIDLLPGKATPAPFSNVLTNASFGSIVTERGGGFTWDGNSRNSRLTPFYNNPLNEGFGELVYLTDAHTKEFAPILPGPDAGGQTFRVTHRAGATVFESRTDRYNWLLTEFIDAVWPMKCLQLHLTNDTEDEQDIFLTVFIDWLMGVDISDARLTNVTSENAICYAKGSIEGYGFAHIVKYPALVSTGRAQFLGAEGLVRPAGLCEERTEEGLPGDACGVLATPIHLPANGSCDVEILIGWGREREDCQALITRWQESGGAPTRLQNVLDMWDTRLSHIAIDTPDIILNAMVGYWLPYQTLSGRIMGRAGLYQAGGAYGFRDQLQDMLAMIPIDPAMVRGHLLLCAAHQFESGDVMHWWHPERTGVRTQISDDLLFLPYVTACYVRETGDKTVLSEQVSYLCDVEIPEGREDWYGTPLLSEQTETLHEHCIRAFRRACRFGAHGLPLMGSGDWNDGMNSIGREGKGESVWLAEFLSVTANDYAIACAPESEQAELFAMKEQMVRAIEEHGWDGKWYRRAYMDDGTPIGSVQTGEYGCRIDAIAQSWAVMADLNRERIDQAMDEVWEQLVDGQFQIIKLLAPPFNGENINPGYIKGYVPGIRENGGQYTHAACWVVMAYAKLGQAERAWKAFEMLLPPNHTATEEQMLTYKVEPYVIAADVYGAPPHEGRGGWTWYTGAAAWMARVALTYLMGYERRGNNVALRALLPSKWREASIMVSIGKSEYKLTARRDVKQSTLDGQRISGDEIELVDDGQKHEAVFPPRAR